MELENLRNLPKFKYEKNYCFYRNLPKFKFKKNFIVFTMCESKNLNR